MLGAGQRQTWSFFVPETCSKCGCGITTRHPQDMPDAVTPSSS